MEAGSIFQCVGLGHAYATVAMAVAISHRSHGGILGLFPHRKQACDMAMGLVTQLCSFSLSIPYDAAQAAGIPVCHGCHLPLFLGALYLPVPLKKMAKVAPVATGE